MAIANETLSRLKRTMQSMFRVGNINIKDNSGVVEGRNAADNAYANIRGASLVVSSNSHTTTLAGYGSLASDYTLTLPANDGDASQVLTTDGSGNLSWSANGASTYNDQTHETAFSEASSTIDITTSAPTNGTLVKTVVIQLSATTGTAASTVTVGDEGDADKFFETADADFATTGLYILNPNLLVTNGEKVRATISRNAAETFSGTVRVEIVVPA